MWPWEGGFGLREACLVPRQRSLWDKKKSNWGLELEYLGVREEML